MRGQSQRSSNRVWVGLAFLGVAGIGGLVAGMNARTVLSAEPSTVVAQMPPADVVNLRFPADWTEVPAAPETAPRVLAYASADSGILFSPNPTYALASAGSSP